MGIATKLLVNPLPLVAALLLALAQYSAPNLAFADGSAYIPVGTAHTKKTVVAFPSVRTAAGTTAASYAHIIEEAINSDLDFMDIFRFLNASAFIENAQSAGISPGTFKMSDWSSVGAEFLIKSSLTTEGPNLAFEAYLYDVAGAKEVLAKRYVAAPGDAKVLAHTFANQVVEALTGLPGIFLTKLAMSCDRTGKKEIYVMDFDGTNVKQVTHHRSISFAPAWSPDGTRLAYSLYTRHRDNIKNIDLYEFNFQNDTIRLLSRRTGINSGAAYSPDGSKIALTMSFRGNPDIYTLDPVTLDVAPLIHSLGSEVDPAWSPDGKSIAFVSSRSGMPMVYSQHIDGSGLQRLTYAGRYNATPSWSPQNNKMAFAGWLDKHFDIFIMNPDGSNIERLTKDEGNNEDPFFSPDGNFVAFSSNRAGGRNIYVMNVDGTFVKRLTYGLGNCVAPKWSNPPQAISSVSPVVAPPQGAVNGQPAPAAGSGAPAPAASP